MSRGPGTRHRQGHTRDRRGLSERGGEGPRRQPPSGADLRSGDGHLRYRRNGTGDSVAGACGGPQPGPGFPGRVDELATTAVGGPSIDGGGPGGRCSSRAPCRRWGAPRRDLRSPQDVYFVYSSLTAAGLVDHSGQDITHLLDEDERRITTLYDVQGISAVEALVREARRDPGGGSEG